MTDKSSTSKIEILLYVSVLVLGAICILVAYCIRLITTDPFPFYFNLLLNGGINMVVVTIVFGIYKFFSGRAKVPEDLREKLADRASPVPKRTQREYKEDVTTRKKS